MSLLVALHDVAPPHLAACQHQRRLLESWGVDRATLLVVPDFHGRHPLADSPATLQWLRQRIAAGDEVALHGYHHLQRSPIVDRVDRLRAALFTAGEGECLSQPPDERMPALTRGKVLLQDLLQVPIPGFVAPAWLEPAGFDADLARSGFCWHETATWVAHRPDPTAPDWRRQRGPVIGFATRTRLRLAASLLWAHLRAPGMQRAALRNGIPARVALHPADLVSPAVQQRLELVVRRLIRHLPAATYSDVLGAHARPALTPS